MSQSYSTDKVTIVNPYDTANSTSININADMGTLEPQGFDNCPFCMKTDDLSMSWERSLANTPGGYQHVFDVTLLCKGCGVMMDENGLDMAGAISSLHERWNRRPKRDDFSRELLKARMYDKQEAWMKDELTKWGPFAPEIMDEWFHKSLYEALAAFISIRNTNESTYGRLQYFMNRVEQLESLIISIKEGNGDTSKKLENLFIHGSGEPRTGNLGYTYYQGHVLPVYGRGNNNGAVGTSIDGGVTWDSLNWNTVNWQSTGPGVVHNEKVSPNAFDEYQKAARQVAESFGASINSFMTNVQQAFSGADFSELQKAIENALPEVERQKLQSSIDKERVRLVREAEREEAWRKSVNRSQRNQQRLIEDKRNRR